MWRRFAYLSPVISGKQLQSSDPAVLKLITTFTSDAGSGDAPLTKKPFITFVLGGPGSGKGTQCEKIASAFGFAHLSAGELLREEISSHAQNGELIQNVIKEGQIVPSEITIGLIRKAINSAASDKILIDGFPRCEENRIAFEKFVRVEPDLVIFFECPEEEMVKRILSRNQGRIDDNLETIKKRLKVFENLNMPVVEHYSSKGKVHKINATGTADEIFDRVRQLFVSIRSKLCEDH
ncbi:UMP/CMP kinase 2 [Carex littledalei]|uniref:adenylate kinase n=1 Tax=Carex littledalei TaxID=544730 RepID=A0A833QRD9_9POAL|nr:UMP/CMP kinase 2 [Carex littledalei]